MNLRAMHQKAPQRVVRDSARPRSARSFPQKLRDVALAGVFGLSVTLLPSPALADLCTLVDGVAVCRPGVEQPSSEFYKSLIESSKQNKSAYDESRLDRFYNRQWAINKIVGAEVLKEPCDPRQPEYSGSCIPNKGLPPLPEDKGTAAFGQEAFELRLREKREALAAKARAASAAAAAAAVTGAAGEQGAADGSSGEDAAAAASEEATLFGSASATSPMP